MRVLSLFPRLDPAGGGLQSGGVNMTLASARAGIEHVVGASELSGARARAQAMVDQLSGAGVATYAFPPLSGLPPRLAAEWSLSPSQIRWIIRHCGDFDAIHVHGTWNGGALAALAATRLRGVPLVVTPHESMTQTDIDTSRSPLRRSQKLVLRAAYVRWATLFVITSGLETSESVPATAAQETIPYPLHDDRLAPPALVPRGRTPELTVGFLGRIAPKKNLDVVVDALAALPPRVRLVVAGDGPAELVAAARARAGELGVDDRVTWLGFVEPCDRPGFLERIDVLAMPSSYESFGMSGAEAMLAGLPLVVSRRTGISELIDRHGGGAVIEPTAAQLAAAIRALDDDRTALARLGTEAQAAIVTELSLQAVGRRLAAAYARALEIHRPRRPASR